jgi:surfactin synthase thioesterase subunit
MIQDAADQGLWCRRYRSTGNEADQLICFPHAGGSASFFFPVATALSPAVDVVAIQYPGRQDRRREQPIDDIAVLADRLYELLPPLLGKRAAFFGHSMGAIVAFEVARRLEADGRGPAHIFASGRRAPSTWRDERIHQRDDDGILAEIRRLSGTNSAVLQEDELMRAALPALRADYRAIETYLTGPEVTVTSPVSVLVGKDDTQVSSDEASAWEGHTTGGFEVHTFPGGHFYLVDRSSDVMKVLRDYFATGK